MTKTELKIEELRTHLQNIDFNKINKDFIPAILDNLNSIEAQYKIDTGKIEPVEIIEETGYSYSGISNVINNEPENKKTLLLAIDEQYCKLRDEYQNSKKKMQNAEAELSSIVQCFIYFHKALINNKTLSENKLTYKKGDENVIIDINHEQNQIKYAYYKRADL